MANSKVKLLGADKFIMALESHNESSGTSGNMCRYIIELDEKLDENKFRKAVDGNSVAQLLASYQIAKNNKSWVSTSNKAIPIEVIFNDDTMPSVVVNLTLNKKGAPLLYFHIVRRTNNTTGLIFSWHHLLMDGYGATLFIRNLVNPISVKNVPNTRSPLSYAVIKDLFKSKRYISKSAKGDIESLELGFKQNVEQLYRIVSFSSEETDMISKNIRTIGSKFGDTSYLLTCTARAVHGYLKGKGKSTKDFWIPVPHNIRKKGASWPIVGNHLSFLFYRIKRSSVNNKKETITSVDQQLIDQIKGKIPSAYSHLMNYLRILPSKTYARLIKGPAGKSLSTFLFTIAAEHPRELNKLFGCNVTNVLSIPPNTYPPGLTFAFNRFNDKLQIIILSHVHLFNTDELDDLEKNLRNDLLNL